MAEKGAKHQAHKEHHNPVHHAHHKTPEHPVHYIHHEPNEIVKAGHDIEKINAILIENFVSLQKVMTNTADKLDSLAIQTSRLLQLFEVTAKSFSEKVSAGVPEIEKDREFLDKLNKLLDQNKVIAKGLTLMEEKIRERVYGQHEAQPQQQAQQIPPLPRFAPRQQPQFQFTPPPISPPASQVPQPAAEEYTPSLYEAKTKEVE